MEGRHPSSFRDAASGFVFERDGTLYRQINHRASADYELLMDSGLYRELSADGLLIEHTEAPIERAMDPAAWKIIAPTRVPFVSYPYEWCFSQLKDAALLTLEIQRRAMERGLLLKDASAYNVQFSPARPVWIDTLSFEAYRDGRIWPAYRQFCRHFLAPLALMSLKDLRLARLLRIHIDGVPLDLASSLLPLTSRLGFGLGGHIHLHAASERRYAASPERARGASMSKLALTALVRSLTKTVEGLRPPARRGGPTGRTDSGAEAAAEEESRTRLVAEFLEEARPDTVWDLSAGPGRPGRAVASNARLCVAFDADPAAVETNYLACRTEGVGNVLPLVMDFTNPSPGTGWAGRERDSLDARGPADAVVVTALIHRLAIGNNVPLDRIAEYVAGMGRWLVAEFLPKEDSEVAKLLASREDIFEDYTAEGLERAFAGRFEIVRRRPIAGSLRTLYLMRRRGS